MGPGDEEGVKEEVGVYEEPTLCRERPLAMQFDVQYNTLREGLQPGRLRVRGKVTCPGPHSLNPAWLHRRPVSGPPSDPRGGGSESSSWAQKVPRAEAQPSSLSTPACALMPARQVPPGGGRALLLGSAPCSFVLSLAGSLWQDIRARRPRGHGLGTWH